MGEILGLQRSGLVGRGGGTLWEEVAYCRPHGCVRNIVTTFADEEVVVAIGFHMLVVTRKLRVAGYQFCGKNLQGDWRLALIKANEFTGLPYGPALKGSDTTRTINPGTSTNTRRDTALLPIVNGYGAPTTIETVSFVLPNVVEIMTPGIYYVMIASDTSNSGGSIEYYGSYHDGYARGLRDILSKFGALEVSEIDPAAITEYSPSMEDPNDFFYYPTQPGTMRICNIDVGLLTEEWFDG
ncbi:MAG TPA: hypothetical protein PKA27_09335 [Fimbriimonadaceae bacterium]|nr:hypothetical protein [Fimbriimonadaceae bacterium]